MALHNTDKGSLDRSSPRPNTFDKLTDTGGVAAKGTVSTQYIGVGTQTTNQASVGQFVKSGVIECIITSAPENVNFQAHGLSYAPFAMGAINNATITGISDNGTTSTPLPMWTAASISGGNVLFQVFSWIMADATNVYVYTLNGTNDPQTTFYVTYYLYKQPAVVL